MISKTWSRSLCLKRLRQCIEFIARPCTSRIRPGCPSHSPRLARYPIRLGCWLIWSLASIWVVRLRARRAGRGGLSHQSPLYVSFFCIDISRQKTTQLPLEGIAGSPAVVIGLCMRRKNKLVNGTAGLGGLPPTRGGSRPASVVRKGFVYG